jgi:hypothetical protein
MRANSAHRRLRPARRGLVLRLVAGEAALEAEQAPEVVGQHEVGEVALGEHDDRVVAELLAVDLGRR